VSVADDGARRGGNQIGDARIPVRATAAPESLKDTVDLDLDVTPTSTAITAAASTAGPIIGLVVSASAASVAAISSVRSNAPSITSCQSRKSTTSSSARAACAGGAGPGPEVSASTAPAAKIGRTSIDNCKCAAAAVRSAIDPSARGASIGVQAVVDGICSSAPSSCQQQSSRRGLYESTTSATSDEGADRADPSNVKVEDFICGEGEIAADFSSVSA